MEPDGLQDKVSGNITNPEEQMQENIDEQNIRNYSTADQARESVDNLGLPVPVALSEEAKAKVETFNDESVGDLPDKQLMEYMGLFTAFQSYAEWELAKFEVADAASATTLQFTKNQVILAAPKGRFSSVKEKEAWASEHDAVRDAESENLVTAAQVKLLKALTKGYERKYNLCSREMTRRLGQMNREYKS